MKIFLSTFLLSLSLFSVSAMGGPLGSAVGSTGTSNNSGNGVNNGNQSGKNMNNAESNPVGPFVQCLLPNEKKVQFIPAFFCELKKGKYHY